MEILYNDQNLVVCIKPVGLDSEKQMIDELSKTIHGNFYPVHRLDVNVGGIMVVAKTKACAAQLSKSIQNGEMKKEYVALVHGTPPKCGYWEDFLFKDSKKNKVFVVKKERKGVKKAALEYTCLKSSDPSLVSILLHTGRSHQIRVQFASRGFPLVGDHKYGSKDKENHPYLYSCKITFPYQNKTVSFESFPKWAKINKY